MLEFYKPLWLDPLPSKMVESIILAIELHVDVKSLKYILIDEETWLSGIERKTKACFTDTVKQL